MARDGAGRRSIEGKALDSGESQRFRNLPRSGLVQWRLCRVRHKRHTFACRRLLRWYADGVDLDHAVAALSTYLGHAKVSDTYWYLTGIPELLSLAVGRFERFTSPDPGDLS
jgi:integrase